ncbi:phage antirepressor KilAC domain-containing protein [Paenibacillus sp. DMB20]|uniref:phage antirepressor KilAC domain-containing protein n=1 Tax=Paenibacillus sp. DMB20 TaxID=1642570 RepID=UPI000ACC36DA|nr:phage antirepressor KilAC domain-containing protein [Paenibacillus sp. DMB20]
MPSVGSKSERNGTESKPNDSFSPKKVEEQAERLTYLDEILRSEDTLNISQIAADYGLTAQRLNQILKEAGIQKRSGGQWILCARYHRRGLTKSVTHPIPLETGGTKTVLHTRWTQAGRLLIHQTLTERGIQANQDAGIGNNTVVIAPRKSKEITVNLRINA